MARTDYQAAPDAPASTTVPGNYGQISVNPNEFGAAIAQGGEKLGGGLLDVGKFYGQVAADNATNNTLEKVTSLLHGDPSKPATDSNGNPILGPDGKPVPDTGYFGLRGADAMAKRAQIQQEIDETINENRQGLSTPAAQYQYDVDTRRYRAQWDTQMGDHADQQQRVWMQDTNNTTATLNLNTIGLNAANPDTPASKLAESNVINAYVKNAQLQFGNDPTVQDGAKLRAQQDIALTRIKALIPTDPPAAQKALDSSAGILASRPDYDQIVQAVKTHVGEAEIGPAADAMVGSAKVNAQSSVARPQAVGGQPAPAVTEQQAAQTIPQLFPGATITSEQRTPAQNAAAHGAADSMHLTGQAIDFRAPPGTTIDQVRSALQAKGLPTTELLQEIGGVPTKEPVFHWGWGQKGGGASGTQPTYPSVADALNANYSKTMDAAQQYAQKTWPQYPDLQDRYVERVGRQLTQQISQQQRQYEVDAHVVQQEFAGDNPPISREELLARGPQVAASFRSLQFNNPYAAMRVDTMLDANAHGKAKTYGTNIKSYMDRVLAPAGDPDAIKSTDELWQNAGSGDDAPLTNTGVNALSDMLAARGTPQGDAMAAQTKQFFDTMHGNLTYSNPGIGRVDKAGEALFSRFVAQALPILQKSGNAVLNPADKNYLGHLTQTFMRTPASLTADRLKDDEAAASNPSSAGNLRITPESLNHTLDNLDNDAQRAETLKFAVAHGQIDKATATQIGIARHLIAPAPVGPPQVPLPQ